MEIKQVTFSYDKKTDQLKNISDKIEMGKITTIIGPNGCGKSTLLGILSQNYAPAHGEVLLDGKSLAQIKPKELAKQLAVVHQQNEAPYDLTVERLVSYGRLPHRSFLGQANEDDERAIEEALASTNLQQKRSMRLNQLSGGEKQRVWIAMALAQKTPILFLDEPTTFLDMYYQIEILELVKALNREHGMTIVMVLHDINQAIRYSDRIVVMKAGEIVASGTPEAVITKEIVKETYQVNVLLKQESDTGLYVVPIGI
ncbi:iron complex transport system ATP-binding protein [Paenibacillus algorifonticola]|uniref:Iron complex transport system ATP-binding protein n=1 Tax=Paenibacillus algorifonticola TaxID=684063 RepID=A0A1I2F0D5_9BACL|nr:ABC transporter ATP-binding protein [Paenibacillus algorifonticola]SFE98469.1 iron complex transport system ATP-binding protein [Paenibacillus algorifonticola]